MWLLALYLTLMWLCCFHISSVHSIDCRTLLADVQVQHIDGAELSRCLQQLNNEALPQNVSLNIWRLTKASFDGIENIPVELYGKLRYALTVIPVAELRNISMQQVEVVEAFGAVRTTQQLQGFSGKQLQHIAAKVRDEWMGKNPHTYSQYDLMALGEIICHLNATDISQLHADAFKAAAEWIGNIEQCPRQQLKALAALAQHSEAFGAMRNWSKLDVIILGNIINGLASAELASIDKQLLQLNRYYTSRQSTQKDHHTGQANHGNGSELGNSTTITTTATNPNDSAHINDSLTLN